MNDDLDSVRLLTRAEVAQVLNISTATLDDYVKRQVFPRPIQHVAGGRKMWKFVTVRDWIDRRSRSRYSPPKARGALKQGHNILRRMAAPRHAGKR